MLANRSMPPCTVIPELAYPNVREAAEWLAKAFGFSVRIAIGDHRVQLNVGDGALVLVHSAVAGRVDSVMIRIDDVIQHCRHAAENGARIVSDLQDHPFGERQYTAEDFSGRRWTFSQSIADVDPKSWGGEVVRLNY